MVDKNIDLSANDENDNVLRYIYMLKEHLETLSLIWRGLAKDKDGDLIRVSDPYSDDDFIYEQINALTSVLNSHTFVSNVNNDERNYIILDTYAAFLSSMTRDPLIDDKRKPMMRESFFNTLILFLNIIKDGAGAQFTLGAQTGLSMDIYKKNRENVIKPFIDIPRTFGFGNKNNNNQNQNDHNNNNNNNKQYRQEEDEE